MSVLDFQDLTACANKERKAGYWKLETRFDKNGMPFSHPLFVSDRSTKDCKYDRKAIDPACAAAQCGRRG